MARVKQEELTYIDLISMLYDDISSDVGITREEKDRIDECIETLANILFKYSA